MKGQNTLILNQATVVDALQEYLDRRTTVEPKPKVVRVANHSTFTKSLYSPRGQIDESRTDDFEVTVEGQ